MLGVRRWPVLPTLVVLAAVAAMVMLGFWQLDRLAQKEAMIARYQAARELPSLDPRTMMHIQIDPVTYRDTTPEELHYRHAAFNCSKIVGRSAIAGRNSSDEPGYVHIARCMTSDWATFDGPPFQGEVVLGWSRGADQIEWNGGAVTGSIAPGGERGWRLVANPPQAGLQANATPDPNDLPNNHLAYAVQWFFFAATALVIYVLALRRRERG